MNTKELNKLMSEIQSGDENAFTTFYQNTYKGVFSFVYSYVKNWHTSEDILQETYIKVKLNADKFKAGTNSSAWLLQIAKNTCIDYLRKQESKPTEEIKDYNANYSLDVAGSMYMHDLLNKYLDDVDRQIVLLHVIEGYKNREIAKILDIPLGTVLWRYNKALKILKDKIKEE